MFEYMKFRYATRVDALPLFRRLADPDRFTGPRSVYCLAIETRPESTFAGWLGVEGPDEAVEFGWYLTPPNWNRGYATEATALLFDWGFRTMGYRRMIATCDPENVGSKRVLTKAGM